MCKMILVWIIEMFLILSFLLEDAFPLKDVVLSIEPKVVQHRSHSRLRCTYDLEGQDLYAVKWYRGTYEFYRFTPSDTPSSKVFPVPWMTVDVHNSNSTQVVLRDIEFEFSGNFTCEVTADKTFSTREDTQSMLVVELPEHHPKISVGREPLDYGDALRANCTSPPARPKAMLTFFLNGLEVARSDPLVPRHYDQSEWSDLILDMVLSKLHFENGKLTLRCVAQVEDIYTKEAVLKLPSARDPVPERVSAFFSTGGSSTRDVLRCEICLVIVCYISLMFS